MRTYVQLFTLKMSKVGSGGVYKFCGCLDEGILLYLCVMIGGTSVLRTCISWW